MPPAGLELTIPASKRPSRPTRQTARPLGSVDNSLGYLILFSEDTKITTNWKWYNGTPGGKVVFKWRTYIRRIRINEFKFNKYIRFVAGADLLNTLIINVTHPSLPNAFYTDFIYGALDLQLLHSERRRDMYWWGRMALPLHTWCSVDKVCVIQADWAYLELQPPLQMLPAFFVEPYKRCHTRMSVLLSLRHKKWQV